MQRHFDDLVSSRQQLKHRRGFARVGWRSGRLHDAPQAVTEPARKPTLDREKG
jgi:hypothetical protein